MDLSGVDWDGLLPIVAIIGGLCIAALAIVSSMMRAASKTREMEKTRREVAAYVAEGSITPEEAERLLNAGLSSGGSCCSKQA
ncbi:MAG: hypothetical protein D6695_03185 [Planctomycetota bacterium]|nr:MAG: hypothetical protein D6695_03185 [Planctomycetota bacterium]